ncbi:MAG TPA: dienelactone hydrolase family protein [Caulobacteraceae bacterium]|nr:dienelactone hydrolase family protein [Caulobacteraceae bacterium]
MKFIVAIAACLMALLCAPALAGDVGFQAMTIPDGDAPPLKIGVWYPTATPARPTPLAGFMQDVAAGAPVSGQRLPLVVMSHGTGGWFGGHYDTALALAHAGFVVAAVSHTGDTYADHREAMRIWQRPEQIHRLIDYMLATWPGHAKLDPSRVGVFGFSAGGFTALVAAGGTADLGLVQPHCAKMPNAFECGVIGKASADQLASLPPRSALVHDARIKAAVVAAPALGFAFGREGLAGVTVPLQLWRAEYDHVLPHPDYAQAVADALPRPPEYHVVRNADHYDFLAPCNPGLARDVPEICAERPGFDRSAFHAAFNAAVVQFFERTLAP